MSRLIEWRRFWCPEGVEYPDDGHGRLFDDPDGSRYVRSLGVRALEEINARLAILLGEPGVGKSATIRASQRGGEQLLDLREFDTAEEVGNAIVRLCGPDTRTKALFIDSFDEARIEIRALCGRILRSLSECNERVRNLRICIVSRTVDWPRSFQADLEALLATQAEVFELLPLRRRDVDSACSAYGVDAGAFHAEVRERGLQTLTATPDTLLPLVDQFASNRSLPKSRIAAYEAACIKLCSEPADSRRRILGVGGDPIVRLDIASRIAAVCSFCGVARVRVDDELSDDADALSAVRFAQGCVRAGAREVWLTVENVRDALATGLFSGAGVNRVAIKQRTYSEYLTARYLARLELDVQQVTALLQHPIDRAALVPQLGEVTAWLISMRPNLLDQLLPLGAHEMLRVDPMCLSEQARAAVIQAHLAAAERGDYATVHIYDRNYRGFSYPGLAEVLSSYLRESERSAHSRMSAIEIARQCRVSEMQSLLVTIALSSSEDMRVRAHAANALEAVGDSSARAQLASLVRCGEPLDSELKGCVLRVLWGDERLIELPEVLAALRDLGDPTLFGTLRLFAETRFLQSLTPSELVYTLRFLRSEEGSRHPATLMEAALREAWHALGDRDVFNALADSLFESLDQTWEPLPTPPADCSTEALCELFTELARRAVGRPEPTHRLPRSQLVTRPMFSRLVGLAARSREADLRQLYVEAAQAVYSGGDDQERILRRHRALRAEFPRPPQRPTEQQLGSEDENPLDRVAPTPRSCVGCVRVGERI